MVGHAKIRFFLIDLHHRISIISILILVEAGREGVSTIDVGAKMGIRMMHTAEVDLHVQDGHRQDCRRGLW